MNLPNKLTVFRVILIPFFVLFMLAAPIGVYSKYVSVTIFIVASVTDWLDGSIARKHNLVTNFGKFADPLADKLLVGAALICLSDTSIGLASDGKIPAWIVIVIISREFIISGFRTLAADAGVVLAAGWWGKVKTACQMVMIIVLILHMDIPYYYVLENLLVYLSLFFTLFSMIDYFSKNFKILTEEM